VLIRWKIQSHSVSNRYPVLHVKIVSWHHSLVCREFRATDALKSCSPSSPVESIVQRSKP
jgi:hypothetical protein